MNDMPLSRRGAAVSVPSPRGGEGQGEGAPAYPDSSAPPHPALRADLSPQGRGDRAAIHPAIPKTLRSIADLVSAGLAPEEKRPDLNAVAARYAVAITPVMAELIDRQDPADPIARQFVPDAAELVTTPQESADPIGDNAHEVSEGLIHRYPDRVLFKLVSVCPVYCRFCFRRETVGRPAAGLLSQSAIDAALGYIRDHHDIWEVILSGGDPLIAAPRRLKAVMRAVSAIDHVKVVRFHSRVPVVAPERVTEDLTAALAASGKTAWLAVHANHPRELTSQARAALKRLADAGLSLVSQTVLLKGVNDDVGTMSALMRGFVEAGVKPYYLHHGDLAPGTAHFRTTIAEGQALMKALRGRLSGLCQPTYVLDIPGGAGKAPVGPDYLSREDGACLVEDFTGTRHAYDEAGGQSSP